MVVAIAAGAVGNANRTWNPLEPNQTLTAAIASLAIGSDQVKTTGSGLNAFEVLYLLGLILFVFTLALNVISERFVRRPEAPLMASLAPASRSTVELRAPRAAERPSVVASSPPRSCSRS